MCTSIKLHLSDTYILFSVGYCTFCRAALSTGPIPICLVGIRIGKVCYTSTKLLLVSFLVLKMNFYVTVEKLIIIDCTL